MNDYVIGKCANCEPIAMCYECYILSGQEARDIAIYANEVK